MCTAIIIGGFVMSGKTAMRDFLAEIRPVHSPRPIEEFIILSNPDGILSLETELTDNWDPFHSDLAIKRFLKLAEDLHYKFRSPYFYKTHQHICKDFLKISKAYVDELLEFSHRGIWYGINSPVQKIGNKLNRMFNSRIFVFYQQPMYVSYPHEKFIEITGRYLDNLMSRAVAPEKDYYTIMEPYASLNCERILSYFNAAKMIIVRRDPRDAYLNLKRVKSDYFPTDNAEHFVKGFHYLQLKFEQQELNPDKVLVINFEDLVLNYDKTADAILSFLNIKKSLHVNRRHYFNPENSIQNLRTFESYHNQAEIEAIYTNLQKYCYKFPS